MKHLSQPQVGYGKPRKVSCKSCFRNLDAIRFTLNFPTFLPDGVMAAPEILDLLVQVRILVGQPFEKNVRARTNFSLDKQL